MENITHLLRQVETITRKNEKFLDATGGRFNMFRVCGVNHYENTHSAILAEFLRPDGTHGVKEEFLKCFVERCCNGFTLDNKSAVVWTEHSADEGRMDITIEDSNGHAIIIENKVWANDQWKQLQRYDDFAQRTYGNGNYVILYLTLWGNRASEDSEQGFEDYRCISYKDDIIKWLDDCARIAAHLPTVRETIFQYINHIKSLTGQDMTTECKKEIMRLLCMRENLDAAYAVGENFTDMKNYMITEKLLSDLSNELKIKKEQIEVFRDRSGAVDRLEIPYPEWSSFRFRFNFREVGFRKARIGIASVKDVDVARQVEVLEKLNQKYPSIKHIEEWGWIWVEFPQYVNWGKEAMIAIQEGKMVGIFKDEIEKIVKITIDLKLVM